MYISLENDNDIPIYEQLKNQIIIGIAKGELKDGDRLPSVRSLASDLAINLHTVNKAYQHLEQEGFLQINRQRGVFVQLENLPKITQDDLVNFKHTILPLFAALHCKGMSKQEIIAMAEEILVDDLEVKKHE